MCAYGKSVSVNPSQTAETAVESTFDDERRLHQLARLLVGQSDPGQIAPDQWRHLIQLALRHQVLGPLYAVSEGALDETLRRSVARHMRLMVMRDLRIQQLSLMVQTALNEHDIDVLWLKGNRLAYTLYPQSWQRQRHDIDILLRPKQRRQALTVLLEAGFKRNVRVVGEHELSLDEFEQVTHHILLSHPQIPDITVEFHHDIFRRGGPAGSEAALTWFWEQSEFIQTPIGHQRVMTPDAIFLHLAVHDTMQHEMAHIGPPLKHEVQLKRKYDIYLLLKQHSLDWDLIDQRATWLGWDFAVARSLDDVQRWFGLTLSPAAQRVYLTKSRHLTLSNPLLDPEEQSLVSTLRHLRELSPALRWQVIRHRVLFPPRDQVRKLYNLPEDRTIWPYYVYHWGQRAYRLGRIGVNTLWHRLRNISHRA